MNLNAMHVCEIPRPWYISFSYGRALQSTCVTTWAGKDENIKAAQDALILRAKANSEATLGKYVLPEGAKDQESLYAKNYVY